MAKFVPNFISVGQLVQSLKGKHTHTGFMTIPAI